MCRISWSPYRRHFRRSSCFSRLAVRIVLGSNDDDVILLLHVRSGDDLHDRDGLTLVSLIVLAPRRWIFVHLPLADVGVEVLRVNDKARDGTLVQATPRVDVRVVTPARFSEVAVQVTPGVVRAVASINMCAWLAQPVQLSKQHASQPASPARPSLERAKQASKQQQASQTGRQVRNFWGGSSSHGKSN